LLLDEFLKIAKKAPGVDVNGANLIKNSAVAELIAKFGTPSVPSEAQQGGASLANAAAEKPASKRGNREAIFDVATSTKRRKGTPIPVVHKY